MGIFSRFKAIMEANVNAMLDKVEDPVKMIDQTMRQLAKDLAAVKRETAGVMAEETRTRCEADANIEAVKKYIDLAKKALTSGNEEHARVFLNKKNELEAHGTELQSMACAAQKNAVQMRQMHDKLVKDINSLRSRKQNIKANVKMAKATERINEMGSSGNRVEGALSQFNRFEQQAQERLDRARALTTLNEVPKDEVDSLKELYRGGGGAALDDELAALKIEMGLAPKPPVEDDLAALYAELGIEDSQGN
ncbi:MAG: PspA/IM30 family protein [Defluviitaleaceae bacterium]|nr:PspA/IM30 family protein [Defluviitaleaceae bacterium]